MRLPWPATSGSPARERGLDSLRSTLRRFLPLEGLSGRQGWPARPRPWNFSRRVIDSKEALRIGLLNGIFPDESFEESVLRVAKKIAQKSLPAIQGVLESVLHGVDKSLGEAMVWESHISSKLILTEDLKEGISAFFERRKPLFKNR